MSVNGLNGHAMDLPPRGGGREGGRAAFRQSGLALCDMANDRVLAALTDTDREHWFIAALDAGIRKCDRTCMNLYAEMRGLVNRKLDLAVNVVNLIGASAGEARVAVESLDRAKSLTPRQRCEAFARELKAAGWRCEPPADWSEAVEVNGNGGPHG